MIYTIMNLYVPYITCRNNGYFGTYHRNRHFELNKFININEMHEKDAHANYFIFLKQINFNYIR